jgi:hypothetical protein
MGHASAERSLRRQNNAGHSRHGRGRTPAPAKVADLMRQLAPYYDPKALNP